MSSIRVTTNFKDNFGTDLGDKLITKDYLMSVYPSIAQELGKTPELWAWGVGSTGQLGNAAITDRSTPVTTSSGGTNWKQVSCGSHIAAIKTDGTLWTWGNGTNGRLGNGVTTGSISTPITTFLGGTNWKQVSCGFSYAAAIKTDGTLWLWGSVSGGQLGNTAVIGNTSTPVTTFLGGTNWKQVSCGFNCTAAIKTDGTLWLWGAVTSGQLGNAVTTGSISTPITTFLGGTNWKQVSCGDSYTAAIKNDGTLWTWGSGINGQLGNASTTGTVSTPITTFLGGSNWKQVECGNSHTAAIKTDGTLWLWGLGGNGQLGNTVLANTSTPVTTFLGGTNWKQVSGGYRYCAAIKTDGTLWTWGLGTLGQLGNATTISVNTPITTFAGGTNWKQISSGSFTTSSLVAAIESVDFI